MDLRPRLPQLLGLLGPAPEQRVEITTVSGLEATIRDKALEPPGIMVIGEVASVRERLGDLA